jgi:antitoxin ParD1/3/4
MANAVTVTLGGMGDRAREWIAQGRYASMSEVVREGLRLIEREEAIFNARLRAMVDEAVADPRPYVPLDEAFARIRATPLADE